MFCALDMKYLNMRARVALQILLVLQYDEWINYASACEVLAPFTLLIRALSTSDPPNSSLIRKLLSQLEKN